MTKNRNLIRHVLREAWCSLFRWFAKHQRVVSSFFWNVGLLFFFLLLQKAEEHINNVETDFYRSFLRWMAQSKRCFAFFSYHHCTFFLFFVKKSRKLFFFYFICKICSLVRQFIFHLFFEKEIVESAKWVLEIQSYFLIFCIIFSHFPSPFLGQSSIFVFFVHILNHLLEKKETIDAACKICYFDTDELFVLRSIMRIYEH